MKYGLVACALLAGCLAPEPRRPELIHQIAAPEALHAKPLAPGQWVTYEERVGDELVGQARFSVEGKEPCGTWVRVELAGGATTTWRLCIAEDGHVAVAQLHGEPVDVAAHAAEIEVLRSRIVPPRLAGTFIREDVVVPAGHFRQALRVADAVPSTWLHPDVPLGAAVQIRDASGRADVLVAYSDQPARVPVWPAATPSAPARGAPMFVELRIGGGWLSRVPRDQASQLEVGYSAAGAVVSRTQDLLLMGGTADSRRFSSSDDTASRLTLITIGQRWSPFRTRLGPHPAFDREAVYLDVTGGYARLDQGMAGVGNGLALATGAGWELVRARDWAAALHLGYELAYLDGSIGLRQSFDVTFALQLFLP